MINPVASIGLSVLTVNTRLAGSPIRKKLLKPGKTESFGIPENVPRANLY
jgi:hypothetical protein